MIELYLKVLRKVLLISEDRLKITIRIFSGMNHDECLNFWSKVVSIKPHLIRVRLNDGGTSGRTKYGMCQVTILKGQRELKLMAAFKDKIVNYISNALVV